MRHMLDVLLLPECLPLEMIGFDVHVLMEALQCASDAAVVAGPVTIPSPCCIVCDYHLHVKMQVILSGTAHSSAC